MRKVAILQSNYIPWKGVFDMINMVDTFVFFEDVDYTRRDWRSRNKIKTQNGEIWLTVPVNKSERGTKIKDISIKIDEDWQKKHYLTLRSTFAKTLYFKDYEYLLEDFYINHKWTCLSDMNIYMTVTIARLLGSTTEFLNSKDIPSNGTKDDKLIDILKFLNATHYVSGPAAKDYIHDEKFESNGIGLSYINYGKYEEYPQLFGTFDHYVSVLDLIFNCGPNAANYAFVGCEEVVVKSKYE